ncbi:MAG: beta-ketoacyl-ACP synthase III [Candidatus Latescibacteria bacterium]|nr:beta-ketoacyl-ACP synthase III [bacterium]MBD3424088.1 beta-ketoacyl-ACP synthase III [Candidatus Latescibacterota bacterium]
MTGIGCYVPEKVLTNEDLEKMVDTSDEWIVTRTGIRERRIAAETEAASDLAYHAAREAMKKAGIKAKDLDQIIVATATSDMIFPSTACVLQDRLGAKNAAAYDLTAACSGFIYGLSMAHSMILTGKAEKILVIGAEVLSSMTDYTDRTTCVLFGDGAGAVVVEPCEAGKGILATYMRSDGSYTDLLYKPGGGSRMPLTAERIRQGKQYIHMKGDGLFKYAVKAMVSAARKTASDAGLTTEDVDYLIPHQANIRIIEGVRKRLKLTKDQVIVNIDRIGNTSSASIPIAWCEFERDHPERVSEGDIFMLVAFGGGLTWGAVLYKK